MRVTIGIVTIPTTSGWRQTTPPFAAPHELMTVRGLASGPWCPGWHAAPRDPDVPGSRFVSPMGDAWLQFYTVPANKDAVEHYWKGIALKEGEDLRLLRRDRAWVEVAGFKGGRGYFRKAVLACGEREWRHVEYEYPAEAERVFQTHVDRMSRAFDAAFTQFCDQTVGQPN
jgi:hypothetical protein